MKPALAIVAAVLLLAGCGGGPLTSSSPSTSPSPARATLRNLAAGERVNLACGLSLTVPKGYRGYLFLNAPADPSHSGIRDLVASTYLAQSSLMHSFSVASLTDTATLSPGMRPLLATWDGGAIEVHGFVVRRGTPRAISTVSLIVHLPGRPRGRVTLWAVGKRASDAPQAILREATTMWALFKVQGISLPSAPR